MTRIAIACLMLAFGAHCAVTPARRPEVTGDLPDAFKGWSVRPLESVDWDRSGYSEDDWYARISGGRVLLSDRPQRRADKLPFRIKPDADLPVIVLGGEQHAVAVQDGYVVGFDRGEFGGGALWFSSDGSRRRELTLRKGDSPADYFPENVHGLALFGKDVLAFEGLTHGFGNHGRVVRFRRTLDGQWQASLFADLPACPHAVLQDGDSSWLFATTAGIFKLDSMGKVRAVWQPRGGHLYYPNSLVRDSAGVIYMGMRSFVLRVRPSTRSAYLVDVLVPPRKR